MGFVIFFPIPSYDMRKKIDNMMKSIQVVIVLGLICLLFAQCEKADKDIEWGNSLLYIPQAVLQSGGSDACFYVTLTESINDTTIYVGLYRSGLAPIEHVKADLIVDTDTLAKVIDIANSPDGGDAMYDVYRKAKLLSPEFYTIPDEIELSDGQRENSVKLIVKKQLLMAQPDFPEYNYILPVRIVNPTRYQLNEKLSLAMLVFTM